MQAGADTELTSGGANYQAGADKELTTGGANFQAGPEKELTTGVLTFGQRSLIYQSYIFLVKKLKKDIVLFGLPGLKKCMF